ncbi:MAG: hypothetical protein N2438_14270, partial [Limisphaera sp.]|nr:hypothetical protein [Limisphaera sp.]
RESREGPTDYPMWHPLLKFARQFYTRGGREWATVADFLRIELRRLGARAETACPSDTPALLRWLADGMEYGREVLRSQPNQVEQIYAERSPEEQAVAISVVRETVAQAGGLQPRQLLGPVWEYCQSVFDTKHAGSFVAALERVLCFADFAVWIPWVLEARPASVAAAQAARQYRGVRSAAKPGPPQPVPRTGYRNHQDTP